MHLMQHGDGVKDVAFEVEDLDAIFNLAVARGAEVVRDIWEENDAYGFVRFAKIKTVSARFKLAQFYDLGTVTLNDFETIIKTLRTYTGRPIYFDNI